MDKLIGLSKLFEISLDALVGNEDAETVKMPFVTSTRRLHYEYKSKRTLFGLPLVHVNVGLGIRRAKGIVAVGTVATGIVAIGMAAVGLISVGLLALGLLALGTIALGIGAFGALAVGVIAFGGIAVGVLSIGGMAIGKYALGGYASASDIALGGFAKARIAIGDVAHGEFAWEKISELNGSHRAEIRRVIEGEYPSLPGWLTDLFTNW
jgi:hypothetical protein